MSRAFYFGVWPGDDGGHYLFPPSGFPSWLDAHKAKAREHGCPFGARDIDGELAPHAWSPQHGQVRAAQGVAKLHHIDRGGRLWTVIAWWDYTGDSRPGSNSAVILEGEHEFAPALEHARRIFPGVFDRLARAGVEVVPWQG